MNGLLIRLLLAAIYVGTSVNAGPILQFLPPSRPLALGAVRSYFYSSAAPVARYWSSTGAAAQLAPVPLAPAPLAPASLAAAPPVFDYYNYATAAALANLGYPYNYPNWSLLPPYLKK